MFMVHIFTLEMGTHLTNLFFVSLPGKSVIGLRAVFSLGDSRTLKKPYIFIPSMCSFGPTVEITSSWPQSMVVTGQNMQYILQCCYDVQYNIVV